MTTKGYGVSFRGDENVLQLNSGEGGLTLLKTTELYILQE